MPDPVEEQFDIFDEAGVRLGRAPRSRVHAEGLWHKSVNVFLFTPDQQLFVQRRIADKDICGGCWDLSVAEHLQPDETYEQGAVRGLIEELGIDGVILEPMGDVQKLTFDQPSMGIYDHELKQVFRANWSGPVQPDPAEVDEVRIVTLEQLQAWIIRRPDDFTPWFLLDLRTFGMID